ncbi:MAG: radical SAM protein [Pseudomonadota bacterium]
MDFVEKIRGFSRDQLITEFLRLVPRLSPGNVSRLVHLAEKITRDEYYKSLAHQIRELFETGHPSVHLARRILSSLSPRCRDRLARNLLINDFLVGETVRSSILDREGFRPPLLFVISPTMRCNLKCKGCYAGDYEQGQELSLELIDRILNEAKELGIYFVSFTGGEVLVRPDLFEMYQKHNDLYFQFFTNGTLIDEKMASRFAKLGNVAPMISIEGFEKETDFRRGKGTYQKIMRAMDNLREEGVMFGASVTEMRHNIELLASDEFIDMLIRKGALMLWYFQYIPVGRRPSMDLMPTPEQRDQLRRRVAEIRRTKPIFIIDFWNDGPYADGCIAGGRQYFHIVADGDVEPCVFAHFAVDNIKEKSLREILTSEFFMAFRSRQPYRENTLTVCAIIDNPQVLRDIVKEHGAHPTHPGAETIITDLAKDLDEYARRYQAIADKAWREEYAPYRAAI